MLTESDRTILSDLFTSHPVFIRAKFSNQLTQLIAYLEAKPVFIIGNYLILLSPEERGLLFNIQDIPSWYSTLCLKISQTNDITMDIVSILLLNDIVSNNLTSNTLQQIFLHIFERNTLQAFFLRLVKCLIFTDILTEKTLGYINLELNETQSRCENFQLSTLPTESDLMEF